MKSLIVALATFASLSALAQPMISTSCPETRRIRLPSGGTGFYMSSDCKTVYVLPPEAGRITLEAVTETATLMRCPEMKAVLRNLREINTTLTRATVAKPSEAPSTGFDPYAPLPTGNRTIPEAKPELTEEQLVDLLLRKKDLTDRLMSEYAKISGAKASLLFSIGYADYLDKVRQRNSLASVSFEMVPLKNTRFTFTPVMGREFSPVLSATFPSESGDAMNGSVTGSVELNLFGACPLATFSGDRLSPLITSRRFAAELQSKLTYEYDLLSTVTYEFSYNRSALAKRIREASSRGGFFNSKTVAKLINKGRTDSWFEYKSSCNDARACEEAHDVNVVELKSRIMDEVLSSIALVRFDYPLPPEPAAQPGPTGAQTTNTELRKCAHKYCQIAAGVLDIASATLGSSSKVDQYINEHQDTVSEKVSTDKAWSFTGSMGFVSKDF